MFYRTEAGGGAIREWIKGLSPEDRKRIGEDIKTVESPRMQGPDCSGLSPQIIRGYSLAARWSPQPIDEPVPRSTLRLRDYRRVHPRNHPAPRPDDEVRAAFDRLAEARLVRNSRGLRCGLRLRRRQPIRAGLRQAATRACLRRRRFALRSARRDRQFQQRANLFLERSQCLQNVVRKPDCGYQERHFHEERSQFLPIGLHPGVYITHDGSLSELR